MLPAKIPERAPATGASPSQRTLASARVAIRAATVLALPLVVAALYHRTIKGPMIFDDATTISYNPSLHYNTWQMLVHNTRPLLNLSYAASFQFSRGAPWAHHVGNIIIHALNALLVYTWLRLTLALPKLSRTGVSAHWAAVVVALLFAVHPLQTEAVAYISGRGDALEGFFMLAAMVAMALALRWDTRPPWRSGARAVASLCVIAAVLSKESGAVGPVLLFLFDCAAGTRAPRQVLRRHWVQYGVLGAAWLIPVAMLMIFPQYADTAGLLFSASEYGTPAHHYLYTQPGVIVRYLRLSIAPIGQVFDYEWPIASTLGLRDVVLPALGLLALLTTAWVSWRRRPLFAYAILWFFVTLAPTSSIISIADVIAERRMYLPLIGVLVVLVLLAAAGGQALLSAQERRVGPLGSIVLAGLAIGAASGAAALTWQRNALWINPTALWENTVRQAPNNPRAWANLGVQHARTGQVALSRIELQRAVELLAEHGPHAFPRIAAFIYTHLAFIDLRVGDVASARTHYQAALANHADTYWYLTRRLNTVRDALDRVDHPG